MGKYITELYLLTSQNLDPSRFDFRKIIQLAEIAEQEGEISDYDTADMWFESIYPELLQVVDCLCSVCGRDFSVSLALKTVSYVCPRCEDLRRSVQ